jgi:ankyrin repeat protein
MAAAREAEAEERLDDKKNSELLSAAAKTLTADEAGDETSHILRQLSTEMHESEERGAEASEPIRAPTEASARRGRGASEEQDGDDDEDIDVARALRSAAQEVVREEQGQENNGDHTEDAYADDGADYSLSSDEGGSGGEGSGGEEEVDAEKDKELIQCCARGESSRVSKLLRGGARLLCRDGHGWTPMHWASSRGHVAVINELLDACPNSRLKRLVNTKDHLSGWTPLHV